MGGADPGRGGRRRPGGRLARAAARAAGGAAARALGGRGRGADRSAARGVPGPGGTGAVGGAAWFAASAAIGAATHVGWDAFTHGDRLGSRLLPVLDRPVAGVPLYEVLQYGSSALALAALGGWAARAVRAAEPVRPAVRLAPGAGRGAVAALGAATAAGVLHRLSPLRRNLVPEACFGAGAGLAVGAVGYAAVLAAARRWRGGRPDVRPRDPRDVAPNVRQTERSSA
ncbi:DUF4184 family protein [Kitasatospora sp. NPDC004799]|uniref:DUF4184 family protein n=1 Tax=Kitasatospora sp. NPDC004799 TaxID=3154460 RepID=UPI0033BA4211